MLSAWVLGLLPFGIALYMFAVNPDYIGLLFKTTYGIIMLIVAGGLLVGGDPLDEEDREYRCLTSGYFCR